MDRENLQILHFQLVPQLTALSTHHSFCVSPSIVWITE